MSERGEKHKPSIEDLFFDAAIGLDENTEILDGITKKYFIVVDDEEESGARHVALASLGESDGAYYLEDHILASGYVDRSGNLEPLINVVNPTETSRALKLLAKQGNRNE